MCVFVSWLQSIGALNFEHFLEHFVNANCFMLKKNDSTLLGWRGSCCAVCMCVCLSVTMSGDGARLGLCAWLGCHGWYTARNHTVSSLFHRISLARWLGSRVVSVLDSGAVGPGFKLQPQRCRVTVLGKLFTPNVPLYTKQRNKLVAAVLGVARVTAGLAETNGSLPLEL